MSRESWWERNRSEFGGEWATQIEHFADGYDNPTERRRRAGRYVLWCLTNGHDPTEGNPERVEAYLREIRTLRGRRRFASRTKDKVRACIRDWHTWLGAR